MRSNTDLVPVFRDGLEFSLSGDHLHQPSLNAIANAWAASVHVDSSGTIWVWEEHLHTIWRTDQATATYLVDGIRSHRHGVVTVDRKQFVRGSAVLARLDESIQSPTGSRRRDYLRASAEAYQQARDSDKAEVRRMRYHEFLEGLKRGLKRERIAEYGLDSDELTGEALRRDSEFHHIRRQSVYSDLVDKVWNGVVVNADTHRVITANGASDEDDLLDLCAQMEWDTSWYDEFRNRLT